MGQRVVSAFQAQFVPQGVNFFRLRLDQVSGFCQIIAQGNGRFSLVPLRPFCVLTQRIYEFLISHALHIPFVQSSTLQSSFRT